MPPAFRYILVARWTVGLTVTTSVLLAAYYLRTWKSFEQPVPRASEALAGPTLEVGKGTPMAVEAWSAMRASSETRPGGPVGATAVAERYRLAGTFFIDGTESPQRRAIIDDASKKEQSIVSEGQTLEDIVIVTIKYDRIVIRSSAGDRELWVDFASRGSAGSLETNRTVDASGGTNKFGCVKIEENRWQFSRKPLLDYYQELLDEPDRMIAVFDSMKPVRNEQNKITGYVLGVEGEQGFFDAVGLRQGDVVRSVNSLPMTNRRRAESFINQFLKQQLNAVVLDVDRGGKTIKQVYQVRE